MVQVIFAELISEVELLFRDAIDNPRRTAGRSSRRWRTSTVRLMSGRGQLALMDALGRMISRDRAMASHGRALVSCADYLSLLKYSSAPFEPVFRQ